MKALVLGGAQINGCFQAGAFGAVTAILQHGFKPDSIDNLYGVSYAGLNSIIPGDRNHADRNHAGRNLAGRAPDDRVVPKGGGRRGRGHYGKI